MNETFIWQKVIKFFLIFGLMLSLGCASPTMKYSGVHGVGNAREITIVVDNKSKSKSSALRAIKEWLVGHGFKVGIVNRIADIKKSPWALTFYARHQFDVIFYLAEVEIKVFQMGESRGKCEYAAKDNANFGKYKDSEKTISLMMAQLFGEIGVEIP